MILDIKASFNPARKSVTTNFDREKARSEAALDAWTARWSRAIRAIVGNRHWCFHQLSGSSACVKDPNAYSVNSSLSDVSYPCFFTSSEKHVLLTAGHSSLAYFKNSFRSRSTPRRRSSSEKIYPLHAGCKNACSWYSSWYSDVQYLSIFFCMARPRLSGRFFNISASFSNNGMTAGVAGRFSNSRYSYASLNGVRNSTSLHNNSHSPSVKTPPSSLSIDRRIRYAEKIIRCLQFQHALQSVLKDTHSPCSWYNDLRASI